MNPRFDLVERGVAPRWVDLNGRWAVPGDRYGQMILEIYYKMVEFTHENLKEDPKQGKVIKSLSDNLTKTQELIKKIKEDIVKLH